MSHQRSRGAAGIPAVHSGEDVKIAVIGPWPVSGVGTTSRLALPVNLGSPLQSRTKSSSSLGSTGNWMSRLALGPMSKPLGGGSWGRLSCWGAAFSGSAGP
jgi:hypothetical protein